MISDYSFRVGECNSFYLPFHDPRQETKVKRIHSSAIVFIPSSSRRIIIGEVRFPFLVARMKRPGTGMTWCTKVAQTFTGTPHSTHEADASDDLGKEANDEDHSYDEQDSFDLEEEKSPQRTYSSWHWNRIKLI